MKEKETNWAIVGAGVSSCFLAHLLQKTGKAKVTLFEKSRGLGGRCAVKRHPVYGTFNHGAQFFTNKKPELQPYFAELKEQDLLQKFPGRLGYYKQQNIFEEAEAKERFVGKPAMNSFIKYWAHKARVQLDCTIEKIDLTKQGWCLTNQDNQNYEGFDICVLSVPYPQGIGFWKQHSQGQVPKPDFHPCWALMLITENTDLQYSSAFVKSDLISWYSSTLCHKSQRKWVIHSNPEWSEQNFAVDESQIIKKLITELNRILNKKLNINDSSCHRWRYASNEINQREAAVWDKEKKLGFMGDWLLGGRIENAMTSAMSLYRQSLYF